MRIFLSYRRAEVGGHAGRLSDRLVQRLGAKNVFQDVTDIAAGRDFVSAIREALDSCDVALAVIGPGWLAASTPGGMPRLFEPDDYVRLELASVLSRDLPVAPVLVGGASMPAAADLPEDLRPLVQRQAIVLRDETWHQDVENLLRSLRGERPPAPGASRRRVGVAVGTAVLAAILAIAWWGPWGGGPTTTVGKSGGGSSTSTAAAPEVTPSCPDTTGDDWTKLPLGQNATAQENSSKSAGTEVLTVRAARRRALEQGRWQVVVETSLTNHTSDYVPHADYRYRSIIVGQREFLQSCFDTSQPLVSPDTIGDGRSGYVVSCEPSGSVFLVLGGEAKTRIRVTDATEPSPC